MKDLKDDKNGLIWVNYFESDSTPKKSFWEHFKKSTSNSPTYPDLKDTLGQLDTWESKDISKYILPNGEKLGSHIYQKYFDEKRKNLPEHNGKDFKLWVAFDKNNLSSPLGLTLFSYDNFSQKNYIEYIVVNPNSLNIGNGTKMLKSIGDFSQSGSKNSPNPKLYTFIRKDNTASLKLFKKFGFNPVRMEYIDGLTDDILDSPYYALESNDFTKNLDASDLSK